MHPSNFAQTGFVEAPDPIELARLAHGHGAIVVDDVGSGALLDTAAFGLAHEPTPAERLAAGADLVTFSGDKLVGGPQAGLIVGRGDLIARIRRDPLARAVRPEKVTLAALAATLGPVPGRPCHDRDPRVADDRDEHVEALVCAPGLCDGLPEEVRERTSVIETTSAVGGGSLPGATLPSVGLVVVGAGCAAALASRLRLGTRPVVGRLERGGVVLDLRTVDPSDYARWRCPSCDRVSGARGRGLAGRD